MSSFASEQAFATRSIHAGRAPDPTTGAILTPIHQSTTFVQEAVGVHKGYTYSRAANPTVAVLEENLGALEGAPPAVCFSTGMSALTALCLVLLEAGDRVVVSDVVYGGTLRLLQKILAPFGIRACAVDTSSIAALEAALEERTELVIVESPANPTLKLTDLAAAAGAAHDAGARIAVDNTFLTAALQQPLELGADIVAYSTTKFIEGHNSTLGGALVSRDGAILERLRYVRKALGIGQSPFEAWLTLRGLKTLELRMQRHTSSALEVARWLERQPGVARVLHPDLESFPQRDLAQRQQRGGGGVIAFELDGGLEAGIRVMNSLELCSLAENLGAAETLVTHPASMTHAELTREDRERAGIAEGLVRLSVGLEEPRDIVADLEQALQAAQCAGGVA